MTDAIKIKVVIIAFILLLSSLSATGISAKIFTIGIIEVTSNPPSAGVKGFKTGMAELGYIEGKDVKYIYRNVVDVNEKDIDNNIGELLSLKIDLLLTVANEPALRARKIVGGSSLPVLAVACIKMAQAGIVDNMKYPGGNITGVQVADNMSKAFEWLVTVVPNARKIYLQYNPEDDVSTIDLPQLNKTASQLGIELIIDKVHAAEEAVVAIKNLPKDIDAIFRIPTPSLLSKNKEMIQAVMDKGLPMGSSTPMDEAVVSFGGDRYEMGRQTARLAYQILHGVKPSDLPVEVAEVFLTLNIKMAERVGLNIPDSIIMQAKKIIR